jgi:cob(I)alamin adenosyltransferase
MRRQNSLLRTLLLDTVAEIDTTLDELEDYMDQGNRSALREQRLDERTASALHTYERAVARVLERSISDALRDLPKEREVIKTVYLSPPPPPKPWYQRIFGG